MFQGARTSRHLILCVSDYREAALPPFDSLVGSTHQNRKITRSHNGITLGRVLWLGLQNHAYVGAPGRAGSPLWIE